MGMSSETPVPLRIAACLVLVAFSLPLYAQDTEPEGPPDFRTLMQRRDSTQAPAGPDPDFRRTAVSNAAYIFGVQSGAARAQWQINQMLENNVGMLERISMEPLMLPGNLLPPALTESGNNVSVGEGGTLMALADKHYQIVEEARYVIHPPGWREFLWYDFPLPREPDPALWPTNTEERELWHERLEAGWNAGHEQAIQQFRHDLARWARAYLGRILFWKLLEQRIMRPPDVMTAVRGVVRDESGLEMWINDRYRQIVAPSRFNVDYEEWRTAVAHDAQVPGPLDGAKLRIMGNEQEDGTVAQEPVTGMLFEPEPTPEPVAAGSSGAAATAGDRRVAGAQSQGLHFSNALRLWRDGLRSGDRGGFLSMFSERHVEQAGHYFDDFHKVGGMDVTLTDSALVAETVSSRGDTVMIVDYDGIYLAERYAAPVTYRMEWLRLPDGRWLLDSQRRIVRQAQPSP